jgi:hypothetical protein
MTVRITGRLVGNSLTADPSDGSVVVLPPPPVTLPRPTR